jgi:hypothetical protein
MRNSASTLLRQLEQDRVAPRGELVVDLERAAFLGAAVPAPVLLLTDAALYASRANVKRWERLSRENIQRITVSTDPSGMLTRYQVVDAGGALWFDLALPMARASFRARMEELQALRSSTTRQAVALAALASLATARTMASAASMVSAASVTPVTTVRVA